MGKMGVNYRMVYTMPLFISVEVLLENILFDLIEDSTCSKCTYVLQRRLYPHLVYLMISHARSLA